MRIARSRQWAGFKRIFPWFLFSLLTLSGISSAEQDIRKSMVKIYTVQTRPSFYTPWEMYSPQTLYGSGCIIPGNRILTNAHIVSDQTFIQVRRYGEAQKFTARVIGVSHEADLALLTVDDSDFFKHMPPLAFGDLPEIQQDVLVYGFPEGGDTLSITRGVVSRIEHQTYVHSSRHFLAVQIDAAINPGNSGGPVLAADKITGVVMQSLSNSENIGYVVPVPIIRHFLRDLEDGVRQGFPGDGIIIQTMENEALRRKYGLARKQTGVLVLAIVPGSSSEGNLHPDDVLLSVDGHGIADDGTVEFRSNERTRCDYYTQMHQFGETIRFEVLRGKKKLQIAFPLNKTILTEWLVPMEQYDIRPTYYICGGLVFTPLTKDYLQSWGNNWQKEAPSNLLAIYDNEIVKQKDKEVVTLINVLPHAVNRGYHDFSNCIVTHVNGEEILNLRHMIRLIEGATDSPFIEFKIQSGESIVLERKEVMARKAELLEVYGVPADRSENLMPAKKADVSNR